MYRRARLGITYLPQEASIFRKLSVADNVNAILETVEKRSARRPQASVCGSYWQSSVLTDKAGTDGATQLSGGERRRVEITRALVLDPEVHAARRAFCRGRPHRCDRHPKESSNNSRISDIGVIITDHNVRETLSDLRPRLHHQGRSHHPRGNALEEIAEGSDRCARCTSARTSSSSRSGGQHATRAGDPPGSGIEDEGLQRTRMAIELKQQLKLSQQLVMTPQLQQAIKLLQLSRLELVDLVPGAPGEPRPRGGRYEGDEETRSTPELTIRRAGDREAP